MQVRIIKHLLKAEEHNSQSIVITTTEMRKIAFKQIIQIITYPKISDRISIFIVLKHI